MAQKKVWKLREKNTLSTIRASTLLLGNHTSTSLEKKNTVRAASIYAGKPLETKNPKWQNLGDRNSHYFHRKFNSRRRKNKILSIQHPNGSWILENEEIEKVLTEHWSNLMTSTYRVDDPIIGTLFTPIIFEEVNNQVTVHPSDEEILLVVKGLNSWKAPGPDGLNGKFSNLPGMSLVHLFAHILGIFLHDTLNLKD